MLESETDRDALLASLDAVLVEVPDGEFYAIFEHHYVESQGMASEAPTLNGKHSDVMRLNLRRGDSVSINTVGYQIVGLQPDGTGWITLVLELQD